MADEKEFVMDQSCRNGGAAAKKKRLVAVRCADGKDFSISLSAAFLSSTLKKVLVEEEEYYEDHNVILLLDHVCSTTLSMVVTYLNAHANDNDDRDEEKLMKFDQELVSEKDIQVLKALVLAAYYFGVTGLFDVVAEEIRLVAKNKSLNWIRKAFDLVDDLTPEQKAEIMRAFYWVD